MLNLHLFRKREAEKGFTLVELLVVMVIIGLLVALVGPKFFGHLDKSKLKAAKAQISLFRTALDSFRLEVGRYPTSQEGLNSLQEDMGIKGWDGPYLRDELPLDPWKNPYIYQSPSEHGEYDIVSYGADGSVGGEGINQDVVSWKVLK